MSIALGVVLVVVGVGLYTAAWDIRDTSLAMALVLVGLGLGALGTWVAIA